MRTTALEAGSQDTVRGQTNSKKASLLSLEGCSVVGASSLVTVKNQKWCKCPSRGE